MFVKSFKSVQISSDNMHFIHKVRLFNQSYKEKDCFKVVWDICLYKCELKYVLIKLLSLLKDFQILQYLPKNMF